MFPSKPPVMLLSIGLRLLWYGVFLRLLVILVSLVMNIFFPDLVAKIGVAEFPKYVDYGFQGTLWLMVGGTVLSLTVPWRTGGTKGIYLGAIFGGAQLALELAERFSPGMIPEFVLPYRMVTHVGLMLLSSFFYLRGCAKIGFWMQDAGLETRARRGAFLSFLALLLWIARAGIEKVQPALLNEIPAVERFSSADVALYGTGLIAGLALLLYTNILAFTSRGLRELRYASDD